MAKPSFVSGLNETSATPAKPDKDDEIKYKAKYALEDIERAEGHKRDKELMKHVKKAAKEKMNSLKKIC